MVTIDIPSIGEITLEHLVADFSGTLSVDGTLADGVKERINRLAESLTVHILTADTHGRAKEALDGVHAEVHILKPGHHAEVKAQYVMMLDPDRVAAMGNGNNDVSMLTAARVAIAVCLAEGCSVNAAESADILVHSATDALDLMLKPDRLRATLRV